MKKIIALILSVIMLVSLTVVGVSAAGTGNLLVNGDFNTAALGYWWMRGDWNGGTWSYTNAEGYEGTGALKVKGMGAGDASQNAGLFYTEQEGNEFGFVPLAGEQYQVSFMVNYPAGVQADVYVDINEGALGSGHAGGAGGWEGVSFTFTAPSEEPIKVRMVVNSLSAEEEVIIDNFQIVSLSGNHEPPQVDLGDAVVAILDTETEQLGDNLLVNGDFNSAATSKWWFRVDWNGGYWMRSETEGVDGTGCIKATGAGTGLSSENAGAFYTGQEGVENYLQLEEGKTYQLEATFFRPEGYEGLLYVDVNEGISGAVMCTTNGEWEHVSMRFLGPKDPVKIRVVANALATGGTCLVDDIMLREVGATPTPEEQENPDAPTEILPTIEAAVDYNAEPDNQGGEAEKAGSVWILLVVIFVVIIAVVAVIFLIKNKKKKEGEEK